MDYQKYREKFLKERLYSLIRLNQGEVDFVPRESKKKEYDYLTEKDMVKIDGIYYKKVFTELSDDQISQYTSMKSVELLTLAIDELTNIKQNQERLSRQVFFLEILVTIVVIVYLLSAFH